MTAAEPFLRAALAALDEAGDPTGVRPIVEAALVAAAPLASLHRPANAKKRVEWAARQLAMSADHPARAYSRLRELLGALFEPLAGTYATAHATTTVGAAHTDTTRAGAHPATTVAGATHTTAPAPEVAAAMPPAALVDALAPPPRVLSRDIASTAKLDVRALLAGSLTQGVLGIRAIPQASIGLYATELAAIIASAVATGTALNTVLRAEAIAICAPAAHRFRGKVAAALFPFVSSVDDGVRAAAIDGLHALKTRLDHGPLLAAMRDPVAAVRAAAMRTISVGPFGPDNPRPVYPPQIDVALIAALSDIDPAVRTAALGALARRSAELTPRERSSSGTRSPQLAGPALVEPLRAVVRRGDLADMRTAIYLLGGLGAQAAAAADDIAAALPLSTNPYQTGQALLSVTSGTASERIVATLRDCVAGPRSSAAHTAAFVLDKLGLPVPDVALEVRLARATDELASTDRDVQRSGMSEAERLGETASSLIPTIHAIGERAAEADDDESKALLRKARDTLDALGVAPDDLPRPPSRLEAYLGIEPCDVAVHGAYAVGRIEGTVQHDVPTAALGVWDNGTGKRLFVVDRAELLEFVPGRAEVAVVCARVRPDAKKRSGAGKPSRNDLAWTFERYRVPSGERVGSLAIPAAFTYGWPSQLAIAADLATVWCSDEEPYRFHIKLGDPDALLDEEPNFGRPSRKR